MKSPRRKRPRRRVAVVTGTRAEYGLLNSVMLAIRDHRRLELQLVVTGMHLLRKFGHTVDAIEADGWRVFARVPMQSGDDGPLDQARGLARGVDGLAKCLARARTDIVVVLGDRIEALAGALAAVTTGRFLAHIHAGDLAPGDLDDGFRHAISKLAHVHFAATQASRRRLLRMGERADRVHWVGAPGLDRIRELTTTAKRARKRSGKALVVQHPCGRSAAYERRVMTAILRAVNEAGLSPTILYPNSDRGHSGIVAAIRDHTRAVSNGKVEVVRSLPRDDFLRALMHCDVLVGNSSCGIIEAAAAGTPCVNVGPRQTGRERSGSSVIDAGESRSAVAAAIRAALRRRPIRGRTNRYGDGRAGERIADLLASIKLSDAFRHKCNAY